MSGTITSLGAVGAAGTYGGGGFYGPNYPGGQGGTGIFVPSGTLIVQGQVTGGAGGGAFRMPAGNAGGGVLTGSDVVVLNYSSITGGIGGESQLGFGSSGYGISLGTGAILINHGDIAGGAGGNSRGYMHDSPSGGNGGTALYGTQQSTIYNYGQISGGMGGYEVGIPGFSSYQGPVGNGGDGIVLGAGIIRNAGTVTGGSGEVFNASHDIYNPNGSGGIGGNAIQLGANSTFANLLGGVVKAGNGGAGIYNSGSSGVNGSGGIGVILGPDDTGSNLGLIAGGAGGVAGYFDHSSITITSGNGGFGLLLESGGSFDNAIYVSPVSGAKYMGTIFGGAAGADGLFNDGAPASAGAGVILGTNATLVNGGLIVGGAAAGSFYGRVTYGATGVENNGRVFNTGVIIGGTGGATGYAFLPGSDYIGGAGGIGVDGGFVTNSGTIEGGAGGYGFTVYGAEGDAVDAGTLVVDPGAVFIGNVNVSTLEVAGTSALALSGFGTQFDASQAIIFDAGSRWSVEGDVAGFTGRAIEGFASGDAIVLDGVSIASETFQTGVGLELSIGGSEVTLAIAGNFDTADFSVTNAGNVTIILASSLTTGTPELAVPGSQSLAAGAAKKITGMTLAETPTAAGETFTVLLSDSYGLLSATGSGISGSGTTMLTLSGSLAQVNAGLATLKDTDYTAAPDTISVSATDSLGGVAAPKTIAVGVNGTIGPGKYITVPQGVDAGSLTVTHTGVELVQSGGSASSTALSAHGLQLVIGAANTTQIESGGDQIVGPKGVSSGTTIGQGGYEIVSAGGHAIDTTIATGGTMLLTDGALSSGVIDFAGSNGELLIGGTALPTTVIDGFNLNGSTGDAIVLAGSTYDAGHDTVSLSSGNVLNLDLNGKIEKLFLNPTQNFAGHLFTLSANSFGQVVVTDPLTGAAAVKAGLLSSSKNLAALDNALLNTKAFATLPSVGMSADLMFLAGIGFLPALETVPFIVRGANLAAIGSFSSTH